MRRLLRLLLALALVLIVGGMAAFVLYLRAEVLGRAGRDTQGVARLLDEHLDRTLATTDAILMRAARTALDRHMGRTGVADELREYQQLVTTMPERGELLSADGAGRIVVSTSAPEGTGGFDISDRSWFQALANGTPVVVGPMFHTRLSKRLIFTLSRGVIDEQGRFVGMVSVGIDVEVFADYHQSLVLGRNGFVAALSSDTLILRQPDPQAFVGKSPFGGWMLTQAAAEPNGTLRSASPLDGIERIISYRALPAYNVVVVAGLGVDEVLEPWRHTALALGGAIVVVVAGLLGVAAMAFRAIDREEAIAQGLEATVRDRTEEAEHRAEEARQANESKTRFLAAASHDLRQPLQAAGMFAEVLAGRVDDPRQMEVVDKLRQSIEATNSLLTSLLDVSTLEAGRVKPNLSTFRLMPLLAGLVDQAEPEASAKGLSIGAIPTAATVTSDPVLLERLLRNLLVNAVRYTETGGIRIGCRHRGRNLAIQVWDTGIGIPADKISSVFDDFTRLEAPSDRRIGKGLGLGLGVVRRMAALLGHALELRSTVGKGSCFTVVVPKG